jgi:hypothetical protein
MFETNMFRFKTSGYTCVCSTRDRLHTDCLMKVVCDLASSITVHSNSKGEGISHTEISMDLIILLFTRVLADMPII